MEKDAKTKLIEAAIPLFPQKGYAGVSIREIADAAGVNSAAISYYFGGKEGLYGAVLQTLYSQIDTVLEKKKSDTSDAASFAHDFAMKAVAMHQQNPYLVKYLYMEMINPTRFCDTVIKEQLVKVFRFLYDGIQEAIDKGEFRSDLDVGFATLSLSSIINMYFIVGPMRRRVMQRDDEEIAYVEQAVELFLNGARRQDDGKTTT